MNCKGCGKKLKKNSLFCTECGYYNDFSQDKDEFVGDLEAEDEITEESTSMFNKVNIMDSEDETYNYSLTNNSNSDRLTSFVEDRYIEAYIGEDYKWIMRKPINIYALLLSWMYFIYRKLYLIGILGLITAGLVLRLTPSLIVPYIVIVMLASGVLFNRIYEKVITKRVNKIIRKNRLTDNFTIEQTCKKKGGVNVPIALIIFFIFLSILLLSYIKITVNDENTKFWEENTNNRANCVLNTKNVYNLIKENNIEGELEEAICEVKKEKDRKYDIYLKLSNKSETEYLYFKNDDNMLTLEGNTADIEDIEKRKAENKLKVGEEEFLEESKKIKNKYKTMTDDSKYEDELINKNKNVSEKKHFIITKSEVLR